MTSPGLETKLLNYNLQKTVVIIMGSKKARESLREQFEEENLTLSGEKVDIVREETYLGDQLGISVSESVSLTIKKRIGLVKKGIFEIKSVVENYRSQVVGGIKTGILLWETCLLPHLLLNCSTWMEIKNSDLENLSKVQRLFLNSIL